MTTIDNKNNTQEKIHILIDGNVYDVTDFKKKHPGGKVIEFYNNLDATDAFNELHQNSLTAKKWLKSIPHVPLAKSEIKIKDDSDDPEVRDYRKLREDLIKEGLFSPNYGMQIFRVIELIVCHIIALFITIKINVVIGGIFYGFTLGRNGFLMHDMGHRAFFGNMWRDKFFHVILFCLGIAGSPSWWTNQHNKHHAATQELKHDVDLQTLPVVAFNREIAKGGNPLWLKYQWLTFVPMQFLFLPFWRYLHFRHSIRLRKWGEMICIPLHDVIGATLLYYFGLSISNFIIYETLGFMVGGCYIASIFSLNHTHRPTVEPFTQRNWVRRATDFTTNSEPNYFNSWFTGFLNFQIEHHLFPSVPHPNLYKVSLRVRELCKKNNIPYDCKPISESIYLVYKNLVDVGDFAYNNKKTKQKK
eukprot:TRINITY_DN1905_c0_g1_i1.p1 TRINITY_DN1905_c0_g1~~TRINITY_DN1905_c0_g1_i1.p1  ORF type:complete len:416 (-),score=100.55 TRINITY_DN1905_c0_g1_i1:49-1296(-)